MFSIGLLRPDIIKKVPKNFLVVGEYVKTAYFYFIFPQQLSVSINLNSAQGVDYLIHKALGCFI